MAYARYDERAIDESVAYLTSFVTASRPQFLDIGAGTGLPTRKLSFYGPVIAVDISHSMLLSARENAPSSPFTLLQADATRLPLRADSVHAATFVESIHLVGDLCRALAEATRVVVDDGIVAVVGTMKEDLKRQVFHRAFPRFHEIERRRHPALNDIAKCGQRVGREVLGSRRSSFELTFRSVDKIVAFVRSRPFFALQQMSDEDFEAGCDEFKHILRREFGNGAVQSSSVLTTVVLGAPA